MCKPMMVKEPITAEHVALEITSALSALAMPPEPLKDARPNDTFLRDTDYWAHHAAEHLYAAMGSPAAHQ